VDILAKFKYFTVVADLAVTVLSSGPENPQNSPFLWGDPGLYLIRGSLGYLSSQPKWPSVNPFL